MSSHSTQQPIASPPADWEEWAEFLSLGIHGRSRWRLPILMMGMILAGSRRTVTSWLRGAGITAGWQEYYYFIGSLASNTTDMAQRVLLLILRQIPTGKRVLLALDDTPTPRYGPKVQGAGLHRNPISRPDAGRFVYGHVWVTLAVVASLPVFGLVALPFWAALYVKKKDVESLQEFCQWEFQTKFELALSGLKELMPLLKRLGKTVWLVADGAYATKPFVVPAMAMGIVVVSRLRKDAALRSVPTQKEMKKSKGRRKYGTKAISLARRAGQKQGWLEVECLLYGKKVTKKIKTFVATYAVVGGALRVVLVQEEDGWEAFFCTDVEASAVEILETYAARSTIEQCYADVKEVWGAGEQQVRRIERNVGCFHLNLWLQTLSVLWASGQNPEGIGHRAASPWDDAGRRPSIRDARMALRRHLLQNKYSACHQEPLTAGEWNEILNLLAS